MSRWFEIYRILFVRLEHDHNQIVFEKFPNSRDPELPVLIVVEIYNEICVRKTLPTYWSIIIVLSRMLINLKIFYHNVKPLHTLNNYTLCVLSIDFINTRRLNIVVNKSYTQYPFSSNTKIGILAWKILEHVPSYRLIVRTNRLPLLLNRLFYRRVVKLKCARNHE